MMVAVYSLLDLLVGMVRAVMIGYGGLHCTTRLVSDDASQLLFLLAAWYRHERAVIDIYLSAMLYRYIRRTRTGVGNPPRNSAEPTCMLPLRRLR